LTRFIVALLCVVVAGIASAQQPAPPVSTSSEHHSLDIAINHVGISIGNSRRLTGIRLNWRDEGVEYVNGINFTLWAPGQNPKASVNGLAVGVVAPGAARLNGIVLGALAIRAEQRLTGIGLAPLAVLSHGSVGGVNVGGLAVVADSNIAGISAGALAVMSRNAMTGVGVAGASVIASGGLRGAAIGGLATVVQRQATGVAVGGLAVVTEGPLIGVALSALGVATRGNMTGLSVGGLVSFASGRARGVHVGFKQQSPGDQSLVSRLDGVGDRRLERADVVAWRCRRAEHTGRRIEHAKHGLYVFRRWRRECREVDAVRFHDLHDCRPEERRVQRKLAGGERRHHAQPTGAVARKVESALRHAHRADRVGQGVQPRRHDVDEHVGRRRRGERAVVAEPPPLSRSWHVRDRYTR